ncbi:protein CREG1 [Denticeps clupeoides]|uniref:CREG-like beta-barrel domain-containing protein n=1 Tax=Denticeps clupeoides TaxID=299321 RepID=A0AAY4EXT7_9TELE|nr:protein CREG1 [Denticeps clupeoides]
MALRLAALLLLLLLLLGSAPGRIPPHDEVARVARFVVNQCDWASMATIATRAPVVGQPFSNAFSTSDGAVGSGSGVPYMYLTRLEISVQDLQVNPQASLSMSLAQTDFCRQQGYDPQSPLCAHVILSGSVVEVQNGTLEADVAKKALFSRHPEMMDWPADHDWFFAKMNITQVWVLDYFGGVKTVTPDDYFKAPPY